MEHRKLGDILVSWGRVTEPQLHAGLQEQRERAIGRRIGAILAARGWITEREIALAISEQLGLPVQDLRQIGHVDDDVLSLVPLDYARSRLLLPIARQGQVLTLAMADPFDRQAIHDVASLTAMEIRVVVGLESEIRAALEARTEANAGDSSVAGDFSPVRREHESDQSAPGAARPVRAITRISVLVVDDSPTILRVLQAVLEAQNCEVITAKDGVEGLEKAHQRVPDLIVTDTLMPRMDGLALLAKLKEDVSTREIPVVMLTSSGEAASEVQALKLGADDYIPKTLEPERLLERVTRALNRLRRTGEGP